MAKMPNANASRSDRQYDNHDKNNDNGNDTVGIISIAIIIIIMSIIIIIIISSSSSSSSIFAFLSFEFAATFSFTLEMHARSHRTTFQSTPTSLHIHAEVTYRPMKWKALETNSEEEIKKAASVSRSSTPQWLFRKTAVIELHCTAGPVSVLTGTSNYW